MTTAHSPYATFDHIKTTHIAALKVDVLEFVHRKTGALHYHIEVDPNEAGGAGQVENVFLVGLRTVPMDSTGVAHILEHTVLCGSEKYPVRDPFFMMIRRSLNTFMNAFTSSDWTAYPFATQNKKDFQNLLDVYLDAVFFSRLDELDFAQEGHRLVFAEEDNVDSELVYKGVVYNEMKGAMSSPSQRLWYTLSSYLFPSSTYHYNSGGEPESITDLSYDELIAFYKKHYHPSNAVFMTYGDITAAEHQKNFEDKVLCRFDKSDALIQVQAEKRYYAPLSIAQSYPVDMPLKAGERKSYHVLSWLLGDSTDLQTAFKAHVLSTVLLDNSASPLMEALEKTDLGHAPAPICGLEDSNRELSFSCGLEGSSPEQAEQFEQLVLETLQKVADQGVAQDKLEAALHQFELSQREVTGDGYPYGLKLILTMLSFAVHRGDAVAALDVEPVLDELRSAIQQPNFIQDLVKQALLDNPHRVRLSLNPDDGLNERKAQAQKTALAAVKNQLSAQQKGELVELAAKLKARQEAEDDASILPKVALSDVPSDMPNLTGDKISNSKAPGCVYYTQGTNGLLYQQLIVDLPELSAEQQGLLPYYSACLSELGAGQLDYLQMQAEQAQYTGGLSAAATIKAALQSETANGYFVLSGKALTRNFAKLQSLLQQTFCQPRFDEYGRIRELIAQIRAGREQAIVSSGHLYAMGAASAGMNNVTRLKYELEGLSGIRRLKALDDSLKAESAVEQLAQNFQALHQKVQSNPQQLLLIGEAENKALAENLEWPQPAGKDSHFSLSSNNTTMNVAWMANSQVNFCAKAYKGVGMDQPDAAVLTVAANLLRNGFLHRAVREQGGAYGGGASYDNDNGVMRFYSYRDPRLAATLEDFDQSVQWLKSGQFNEAQIEEAVLGVVAGLDKPSSPAGEARRAFFNELHGRSYELRRAFRSQVLTVSADDLVRVAEQYLDPSQASTAVISNQASQAECERLGLAVEVL